MSPEFDIDVAVEKEQDRHFDACFPANDNEPQPMIEEISR